MYTGIYIVLFTLFVNVREQLRSCEASDTAVIHECQEKVITCHKELLNLIFKTIEWRQKFEEKLTIIESDIHRMQYRLMTYTESERKLREELKYLHQQVSENNSFNKIMIFDILCLMGKYRHAQ